MGTNIKATTQIYFTGTTEENLLETDKNILLFNADTTTEGMYTCQAANSVETREQSVHLKVICKPSCYLKKQERPRINVTHTNHPLPPVVTNRSRHAEHARPGLVRGRGHRSFHGGRGRSSFQTSSSTGHSCLVLPERGGAVHLPIWPRGWVTNLPGQGLEGEGTEWGLTYLPTYLPPMKQNQTRGSKHYLPSEIKYRSFLEF